MPACSKLCRHASNFTDLSVKKRNCAAKYGARNRGLYTDLCAIDCVTVNKMANSCSRECACARRKEKYVSQRLCLSYTTQTASTSATSALANESESETEDQVPSLCKKIMIIQKCVLFAVQVRFRKTIRKPMAKY